MKKHWFLCVLTVVLLLCFLTACAGQEADEQERLELSMVEAYAKTFGHDADSISVDYLGGYQDCHVAYFNGPFMYTDAVVEQKLGVITFVYPNGQKLYVYRDGKVLELSEAYEAGWLMYEMLEQIHADFEAHKAR